ncbi:MULTISPECIES: TolC family protein [unclassified Microcoleus]|uniref:TolC family protein n=1 Tax=unclassified Microcoleus TaxID=2642155 RepID=UPI002FD5B171
MTEQPHEDYLPNSDSPARYDIPWIFRFSLVMLAICGLLAIFAVAFKSSSTVKTDVSSKSAIAPKILPLPTEKYLPHIQNLPQNQALIQPPNQRKKLTTNQRIVIPLFPDENPTSKIKHSPISNSQSPSPYSQLLTTSTTQKSPAKPESIVISEALQNPEKTAESTPENSQRPTIEYQSIEDEPGVELTLPEVVFLGLENNRVIKNQYLERIAQKQDLAVAEGQFVPIFTPQLSVSSIRLRNGGRVATTGEVDLSAQVSVKIPTGGEISFLWSGKQGQDANGLGINSEGSLSQNLELNFNQPLLRGAGVAVTRAPIEIARLSEKKNILSLKSTLIETITQVILNYRELIKAQEQVKISQSSLEIARKQREINQVLIKAGRLAKVEIVTSEKAVADQEVTVLDREEQLKKARLTLLQIIGLDDRNLNITAKEDAAVQTNPLDFNKIIPLALSNSPDYLQVQLDREIAKYKLLLAENNRKWKLDVSASYKNNASNLSDSNSDLRAGLVLTREFGNRGIERDFQNSRVKLLQAENILKQRNQKLEVEVRNAIRDINLNFKKVELAQKSRELAQKQLDIELDKKRLGVGSSRSIDIVNFQKALIEARNAELNARIAYFNALTNLDKIIGTTLETWQVRIENE